MRLLGLQARDTLLQQVSALHVEEEGAVLGSDFARRDYLGEWPVLYRFVRVQVQEMDAVSIQRENVLLPALHIAQDALHSEER